MIDLLQEQNNVHVLIYSESFMEKFNRACKGFNSGSVRREAAKASRNDSLRAPSQGKSITSGASTKTHEQIVACGFNTHLSRPINKHVIFNTIKEMFYGK